MALNVSSAVKQKYLSDEFNGDYQITIGSRTYTGSNVQQGSIEIVESLCSGENFDLSAVEMSEISFTLINFTENISDLQGKTLSMVQKVAGEDVPLGTGFTIVEATYSGEYLVDVKAYDKLDAFNKEVTDWWNNTVTFPITHRDLLISLCTYCGVSYDIPATYCNSTLSIVKAIDSDTITGLDVLGWLQEVAASFYRINRYGVLVPRTIDYEVGLVPQIGLYPADDLYPEDFSADPSNFDHEYTVPEIVSDMEIADYNTARIDKLQISGTIDDIGVIVGTGKNCYKIVSNALLFGLETATLESAATNIFSEITNIRYRPFTAKLKGLPYLETGDFIKLTTLKGIEVYAPILKRTISGSGLAYDSLECRGSEKRIELTATNKDLKTLKQRTHEIINTVDELSSTVTAIDTEINGTNGIAATVTAHSTAIQQNAQAISLKVSTYYQGTAPTNPTTGDLWVDTANNDKIKRWNGTAWVDVVDGNTIVSLINLDSSGVQISGAKVNIDTTTLNLTFGSGQSTVTIQSTANLDGVLFTGNGKVEFETKGEFKAKNLDSSGNEANRVWLVNDSSESSAELYNYWNNIRGNSVDLTADGSLNKLWIVNNRPGANINANNHYMGAESTVYVNRLYNYKFNSLSSTGGTIVANNLQLESAAEQNYAGLRNYSSGGLLANYVSAISNWGSTPYNGVYVYNKDASGTNMNFVQLYHSPNSNWNRLLFQNNYIGGSTANWIQTSCANQVSDFQFYNYHYNGNLANTFYMTTTSNSGGLELTNRKSDGSVRTGIYMRSNGAFEIFTNTGGNSSINIPGTGESGTGNLNIRANNDLVLYCGGSLCIDGSKYGTGGGLPSGVSPTTNDNVCLRNWNNTQNCTLYFYKGLFLGYSLANV